MCQVSEEEAVEVLARQFGVLLMYGWPFGAPGYLRLSYGGIPPSQSMLAIERLRQGLSFIDQLSKSRL